MCSKPKKIVEQAKPEERIKDPVVLTQADTAPSGQTVAKRRKSKIRMDLNTATSFKGLTIPNG